MPVIHDSNGAARYIPFDTPFYKERPQDFLGKGEEYEKRVRIARERILEAVRFTGVPLLGRGLCHEVKEVGMTAESFTDFVDRLDGRRANAVRKQRRRHMHPEEYRLRSPEDTKRRRSALISGAEICPNFFVREYGFRESKREREQFVDLMRWWLLYAAVTRMIESGELVHIDTVWYVPVSVMDTHRSGRRQFHRKSQRSSKRTKHDDRSWHGRPNRDRGRIAA